LPGSLTVGNSGGNATVQLSSGTGDAVTLGLTTTAALALGQSVPSTVGWASTSATGPRSGQVVLTDLTSSGDIGSPHTVPVTGAVVANRVVTASTVNLGREIAGASLPGPWVANLSSAGDDSDNTRVTVGGILFNGTTTSGTASIPGTIGSVSAGGLLTTLTPTGEGLPGESPIS